MLLQQFNGGIFYTFNGDTIFPAYIGQEFGGKHGYIVFPFVQGRYMNQYHTQAMVQVEPEIFGLHFGQQVLIGGGHHAYIYLYILIAAHAGNFSFLKGTQHFGLCVEAHIANFVEEKRTAVGQFKFADALFYGRGERAFFVTEQLAFDQFRWYGSAVYFNQLSTIAVAFFMQPAGHQFFARTVFAGYEYAGLGRRHFFDGVFYFFNGGRFTDHVLHLAYFPPQHLGFGHQRVFVHGVTQGDQQPVQVGRFGYIIVSPFLHCFHRRFDGTVTGNHNYRHIGVYLFGLFQEFEAVHLGHFDIAQYQVVRSGAEFFQAFFTVGRFFNSIAFVTEYFG